MENSEITRNEMLLITEIKKLDEKIKELQNENQRLESENKRLDKRIFYLTFTEDMGK